MPEDRLELALERFEGRYRQGVRRAAAACPYGEAVAAACPGLGLACPAGSCVVRSGWSSAEAAAFDQADDAFFAEEAVLRSVDWPTRGGRPAPASPSPRAFPVGRGSTLPGPLRAEILELRRAGLTYPAIAARLGVGRTTAWHVARQAEGSAA